jgi:hypothetical protein
VSLIAECDRLAEALRRFKEANIRYSSENEGAFIKQG